MSRLLCVASMLKNRKKEERERRPRTEVVVALESCGQLCVNLRTELNFGCQRCWRIVSITYKSHRALNCISNYQLFLSFSNVPQDLC